MILPIDRVSNNREVLLAAQEAASQSGRLNGENPRPEMADAALVPEHLWKTIEQKTEFTDALHHSPMKWLYHLVAPYFRHM